MRHRFQPWIVVALVAALAAGSVAATGNQPPTAAAGLDQTVTSGTTVYLDAGSSRDPDGTLATVSWSIQAPNGSTITPSCRNCTEPTFTPDATGRWTATVTVTDDDGATATDTLYVTVDAPRGPSVSVTVSDTAVTGQSTPVVVDSEADGADLRSVALYHNGSRADQTGVSGQRASVELSHTFSADGTNELRATVTDEDGYVNTTTVSVDVVAPSEVSVSSFGGGGFTPTCDDPGAERVFRNGQSGSMCSSSDMIIDMQGGDRAVAIRTAALDTGIRLYDPDFGKVVNMTTGEQAKMLRREAGDQAIQIERVEQVYRKNLRDNSTNKFINPVEEENGNEDQDNSDGTHRSQVSSGNSESGSNIKNRRARHSRGYVSDTNCCLDSVSNTSPGPGERVDHRPDLDSTNTGISPSNTEVGNSKSSTGTDSDTQNSSTDGGCPPPRVDVPPSVRNRKC